MQNKTAIVEDERGEKIELTVDLDVFNDMETIDLLADLQSGEDGSIVSWPAFIVRVFGKEQKKRIYDFLRDPETGRVPIERVTTFITTAVQTFAKKN